MAGALRRLFWFGWLGPWLVAHPVYSRGPGLKQGDDWWIWGSHSCPVAVTWYSSVVFPIKLSYVYTKKEFSHHTAVPHWWFKAWPPREASVEEGGQLPGLWNFSDCTSWPGCLHPAASAPSPCWHLLGVGFTFSTSVPAVLATSTGHAFPRTHASEGARLCDTTLKITAVVRGAMAVAYNPGWDVWSSSLTWETDNLGALFRATKGGQDWPTSAMVFRIGGWEGEAASTCYPLQGLGPPVAGTLLSVTSVSSHH